MSEGKTQQTGSGGNTYLLVPIFLFFVLLIFAVVRSPSLITPAGIGSAIIVVAPLILATYALTAIVMAGRAGVDLSIGPLIGFVNVCLIQLTTFGYIQSPIAVFLFAMFAGVAYQVLMGLIIVFVRVQPIIVSLSGYLALVGLNLVILPRPGGLAPEWMLSWGAGTSIFSPVLVILILATAAWYIIARTSFWGHLRLMGSDERTAYTSGVRINIVRIGAHAIAGIYAALAAIAYTALISSGDPSQGTTYTLMAVTALVLGGANLAGGRGGAFGSLLGALNIYLITYVLATFSFGTVQSFVTDLAFGMMLVVSLLISVFVPEIQKRIKSVSPLIFFVILSIPALGVMIHKTKDKLGGADGAASSGLKSLSSAGSDAATAVAGSGGTAFMLVVIGIVAVIALVRVVILQKNLPSTGLAIILVIAAFGLVFNNSGDDASAKATDSETVVSEKTTMVSDAALSPDFFELEVMQKPSVGAAGEAVISNLTYGVVLFAAAVLLASLLILVMLPQVSSRAKKISMWWFLAGFAAFALGAFFLSDPSSEFSRSFQFSEHYIALLVALGLFVVTGPLVQTRLRNITQLFIIGMCVVSLAAVIIFAGQKQGAINGAFQTETVYAQPIINKLAPKTVFGSEYPKPRRVVIAQDATPPAVTQLAYSLFLIVLVQFIIAITMGQNRFRNFWPYSYIVVLSVFGGGALFYSVGVPLWKVTAVVVIATITAPIVFHVIKTYHHRRQGSGGTTNANWNTYDTINKEATS